MRGQATFLCRQRLLGRSEVDCFQCPHCELIRTQQPDERDEACSGATASLDTGALARNRFCTRLVLAVLGILGHGAPRTLDFGGGHGVLVRLLRDPGIDARSFDARADNLFAQGFDGDLEGQYLS